MKKLLFQILILMCTSSFVIAQNGMLKEGSVSYVNATNVYVSFDITKDLALNDTLMVYLNNAWTKALVVKMLSSKSCITTSFVKNKIIVGNKVAYTLKTEVPITKTEKKTFEGENLRDSLLANEVNPVIIAVKNNVIKETFNGRLSVSTNGSMDALEKGYNRIRTSFNFDLNNIKGGKLSLSSYFNYQRRFGVDQSKINFKDDFKVYALALTYDFTPNTTLSFGRKINNRMANMGAIDGIQLEHKYKEIYFGGFGGTRPDNEDYSFNKSMFQFGAFVAHETEKKNGMVQTSLAFAEQKYHSNTDRRFVYFQHSNSLVKKLNLFFSLELDLFQNIDSVKSNKIDLTSIYISMRYKPFKKMSLTTSYDNRRNVIYYETYRTYIDQLLNQETRQGVRMQMNYNISKMLNLNLSGFYRYQESRPDPTKNYIANLTFNQIPGVNASFNINANRMKTYYFIGNIYGARLNKDMFNGHFSTELNYRKVNYNFFNSEQQVLLQDIIGVSTNFYTKSKTSIMLTFESTIEPAKTYNRYYVTVSQRFKNKK